MKIQLTLATLLLAALSTRAAADTFGIGANTFDIEFVNIGNPGNVADTTGKPNPAGSVPYTYRIGKFEISRDIVNKANSEGSLGITLADMTPYGGNGAAKPASGVSWFEAAKFVNWLNTSTGNVPAYNFDVNGSFRLWTPTDAGYNPNNLFRNSLAKYFLPSVHEWYKAAYYDPAAGVYYDYPTGSNTQPDGIDFERDSNFDAVFYDGTLNPQYHDVTDVGIPSPYGTVGQGGNIYEHEETEFDLVNDATLASRGFRGGNFGSGASLLSVSLRTGANPSLKQGGVGFRVASTAVPEPSAVVLSVSIFALLAVRRCRK